MIANYNNAESAHGPSNLGNIVGKRLRMQGFLVSDHLDRKAAFEGDMKGWIGSGEVVVQETIVDGLENAAGSFLGLFRGDNLGKMIVALGPA
jgi:NADPH-dependent curcumin reductase CurA